MAWVVSASQKRPAPASDSDVRLGKSIAAFVPPVAAIYARAIVFMALCDRVAYDTLGQPYFLNWTATFIIGVVTPLAAILCIEINILISARATDVRAAQQLGALTVLPFAAICVAAKINVLTLNAPTLSIICAVLATIDVGLFFASRATFQREQILTRWT